MAHKAKAKIKTKGSREARLSYGVLILVLVTLYIISCISNSHSNKVVDTDFSKTEN